MNTIEITLPYQKRHLRPEIKERGGKFNTETKNWSIPDTAENRELAQLIQRPVIGPTAEDRVTNVASTCVDLLNGLKHRRYRLVEARDRIVIESDALADQGPTAKPNPKEGQASSL
jgi:hypothetical protein